MNDPFQLGPLLEVFTKTPKPTPTTTTIGFESVGNLSSGYGNEFSLFRYRLQLVS